MEKIVAENGKHYGLTMNHLIAARILCIEVAQKEYQKYGYIEFMGTRTYKEDLSEEVTGGKDPYKEYKKRLKK